MSAAYSIDHHSAMTSADSAGSQHLFAGMEAQLDGFPPSNQTVYPQPGKPMLPLALMALLGSRTVSMIDGSHRFVSDFVSIKPEDLHPLDAQRSGDAIASLVQGLLYGRRNTTALSSIRIDVPDSFKLGDLPLSPRVRVALQSRPFFDANGPWRHCTLANMVCEQSLGAKLLLSFLVALECGLRGESAATSAPSTSMEEDLLRVVSRSIYAPRSAEVFLRATGWDGKPRESLVQIASRHGISKERARQILALATESLQRHIGKNREAPERLLRALRALHDAAPMTMEQAATLIRDRCISVEPFDPQALLHAAHAFGVIHPLRVEHVGEQSVGSPSVIRDDDRRYVNEIMVAARALLRKHGAVNTRWICDEKSIGASLSVDRLMTDRSLGLILEQGLGLTKLDVQGQGEAGAWYWQEPSGTDRPQGLVIRAMKAVAFFGSVPWERLSERLLDSGARQTERAGCSKPAVGPCVLKALLPAWGLVVDSSNKVKAGSAIALQRCQNMLPPVEEQLGRLIAGEGGRLARNAFLDKASAGGIKPNTALTYLKSSSLLRTRGGHSDPWVELLCDPAS